jgi:hypothetical protein
VSGRVFSSVDPNGLDEERAPAAASGAAPPAASEPSILQSISREVGRFFGGSYAMRPPQSPLAGHSDPRTRALGDFHAKQGELSGEQSSAVHIQLADKAVRIFSAGLAMAGGAATVAPRVASAAWAGSSVLARGAVTLGTRASGGISSAVWKAAGVWFTFEQANPRTAACATTVVNAVVTAPGQEAPIPSFASYSAPLQQAEQATIDAVGGGRLNGALFPTSRMPTLASYLANRGVTLRVAGEGLPPNAAAGFSASMKELILRPNPTRYEVGHELSHFIQFRKLGLAAYDAQSRTQKEQFVFDLLNNNPARWGRMSDEERTHAVEYIQSVGGLR